MLLLSLPAATRAQLPWLSAMNSSAAGRDSIRTVRAEAAVTVSDGLRYETTTVYHDPQRAIFRTTYPDRTVTYGVEGRYFWHYDGKSEREGGPFVRSFVLGHQVHAQLLFFDRLHPTAGAANPAEYRGKQCDAVTAEADSARWTCFYRKDGKPLALVFKPKGQPDISMHLDEWRVVSGIELPFAVEIDDGQRVFNYRFSDVAFNDTTLSSYRAPADVLTNEQQLLRAHRAVMDDHFFGRIDAMRAARADSMLIVSGGRLIRRTGAESQEALGRSLAARRHSVYDDLIRPVVRISDDGTLGWVIVQVEAKGERLDSAGAVTGPLSFVSAWIELYEKQNGSWRMVGNVSNFMPDRK